MTGYGSPSTRAAVFISVFIAVFLLIFIPFTSTCRPGELVDPRAFIFDSGCKQASIPGLLISISVAGAAAWLAFGLTGRRYYI